MSSRGRWRRAPAAVLVGFGALVVGGMGAPHVVPRLAFLPAPPGRTYCSKTQGRTTETARRSGPIWGWDRVSDLMLCAGPRPRRDTAERPERRAGLNSAVL